MWLYTLHRYWIYISSANINPVRGIEDTNGVKDKGLVLAGYGHWHHVLPISAELLL